MGEEEETILNLRPKARSALRQEVMCQIDTPPEKIAPCYIVVFKRALLPSAKQTATATSAMAGATSMVYMHFTNVLAQENLRTKEEVPLRLILINVDMFKVNICIK